VFDPLNLILLAAAAFVLWRLVGVLGQRTGHEGTGFDPMPKPTPVSAKDQANEAKDAEVRAGALIDEEPPKPVWHGIATEGSALALGLEALVKAQPSFNVDDFMNGARIAYEMILEAYAKGDKQVLKPLLAREVMDEFSAAIDDRNAGGHTAFLQFVGIKSAKIEQVMITGKKAQIGVTFLAEMISATLDRNGNPTEGNTQEIRDITDRWTFERDISSRDPNWRLVDTSADPA
jgi:predicted lipid-binding transport protein (Tim44 family)